ncbi:MAG TPA: AsmA family protein, partial [Methylophilaceae bacterium]|nr:AsmA family protein [Methylophilaceae bacterium]
PEYAQSPALPTRRPGLMRTLLLWLASLLLLAAISLGVAFAVCEAKGWPFLRAPAETFLSQSLQREVRIAEPFRLKLLGSVRLDVGGLWIAAPKGFKAPHFVDMRDAELELRYRDLWQLRTSDLLRIRSLKVGSIDAQLIRLDSGKASWQFDQDETAPDKPLPMIETLVVRNGRALLNDTPSQADLDVRFKTEEGSAQQQARSHVSLSGRLRGKPIKGDLRTQGLLPVATQDADSPPIASAGWVDYAGVRVDFDGSISDLFGKQDIQGKFAAKGASLSILGDLVNSTLPTTDPFKLNGRIRKADAVWQVDVASAEVGSSQLSGTFSYDPRPQRPLLVGKLNSKNFVLADLAPAFGTRNPDGSKAKAPDGKTLPDRPLDLPSLNKMDAKVEIDLAHVDLGSAFARPISPLKGKLTLDDGKLALTDLDARTADGSVSGLVAIDAAKGADHGKAQWQIDLNWQDIDVEKWLQVSQDRKQAAKEDGQREPPPAYVTGTLNGTSKLRGEGASTAALLSSLDGEVSFFIRQGTISHLVVEVLGLDIAQGLGILLTKDQSLPMQCAVMDFDARQGVITPKVALLDTPVTVVVIDGKVNLATEQLDLRLAAKPKNVSPLTVRSPIRVTGTFADPKASPESGPIAARVAGAVALAFVNPLAAILPFVDLGGAGKEASPCNKTLSELSQKQAR